MSVKMVSIYRASLTGISTIPCDRWGVRTPSSTFARRYDASLCLKPPIGGEGQGDIWMATLVRKSDLNPAAEEEVSDLKISRNQNCNWRGHAKALPDGNHLLDSEKRYEFPGTWRVRFMGRFTTCL